MQRRRRPRRLPADDQGSDRSCIAHRDALQTLVSRENDPFDPAVVTVGSFHAGTKSNIIPNEAKLALTVRSYTPETRKLLLDGIARIARGEAIAAGLPDDLMPSVEIEQPSADATFNTPQLTQHLTALFNRTSAGTGWSSRSR